MTGPSQPPPQPLPAPGPPPAPGSAGRDVLTDDRVMTSREVGALLRVQAKTVARWAAAGLIKSTRTPGGDHRFRESDVRALLAGSA